MTRGTLGLDRCRSGIYLAACLTVAALVFGLGALKAYDWLYRPDLIIVDPRATPFWGPGQLNGYYIAVLKNMYDSGGQRLALSVTAGTVGFIVLFAPFFSRLLPMFDSASPRRLAQGLAIGAALVGYAFSVRRGGSPMLAQLLSVVVGLGVSIAVAVLAGRARRGLRNRLFMTALLIVVATANLPGIFTRIDLSKLSQFDLMFVEHHFSTVLGQADRLAVGQRLGEFVSPTYGFLLHLLLALYQRAVHPLT